MELPITAIVTAACALLLLGTAIDTVRQRLRLKVAFGDAGDGRLISASRSHANLAEHAPVVILMLGLLEMSDASQTALIGFGAVFLIGRVAHVIGLYTPSKPGQAPIPRQIGVISTCLTLAGLSIWILWILFGTV